MSSVEQQGVLELSTAQLPQVMPRLRAGDLVALSGTIYTARDAAHKRIFQLLDEGKPLPFPLEGAVIYYAGPTPGQKGMAVGALSSENWSGARFLWNRAPEKDLSAYSRRLP